MRVPDPTPICSQQGIRSAPDEALDARLQDRPSTHGARLEGDVQRTLLEEREATVHLYKLGYAVELAQQWFSVGLQDRGLVLPG